MTRVCIWYDLILGDYNKKKTLETNSKVSIIIIVVIDIYSDSYLIASKEQKLIFEYVYYDL